jgi:hypothetical protein
MKKFILLTILLIALAPTLVLSAPSLGAKMQGKILLAVEDKGKTYYVFNGNRYQVTQATAMEIFKKLAVGITNKDLEQIPLKDVGIDPEHGEAWNALNGCELDRDKWKDEYTKMNDIAAAWKKNAEQCDYTPYTNQINKLNADINSYTSIMSQANEALTKASAKIIELNAANNSCNNNLNICVKGFGESLSLTQYWKNSYNSCARTNY